MPYGELAVKLEPGDTLLLYTDGVTEARNPRNETYGLAQFVTQMATCRPRCGNDGSRDPRRRASLHCGPSAERRPDAGRSGAGAAALTYPESAEGTKKGSGSGQVTCCLFARANYTSFLAWAQSKL